MPSNNEQTYSSLSDPPIPSYEEATSSTSRRGPAEISDDAERQDLLSHSGSRRRDGYEPPAVRSARSSEDSLAYLAAAGSADGREDEEEDEEDASLRQDMEQLTVLDPSHSDPTASRRTRMRSRLSKRLSSLTTSLSGLSLPTLRIPLSRPRFLRFDALFAWLPALASLPFQAPWSILARLVGLFVVVSLVYALFVVAVLPGSSVGLGQPFSPEWVRAYAQNGVDAGRIGEYLRHVTSFDHVAGSEGDFYLAQWVEGRFRAAGMDAVETQEYDVYLNYPKAGGRRVAIVEPPELAWEAKLEEEPAYDHPTPQQQQTLVFHGHSRAGNVTGPLIYANYGSREDFQKLRDDGVNMTGVIALVRYYGTQGDRALKVKAAEQAGAVGCLIYSDPKEDGFLKGEPWPKGRWRPSDGVQRGAVSLMSWVVGDVLTPGWASVVGAERVSKDDNPGLVNIPSLPLAWRDAQRLLQVLKGHGQVVPEEWVGGVPDVEEWWSGNRSSPIVHLKNEQDEVEQQAIWNVMGVIEGVEEKAKKVIVGNHRDSWCFGAGDPGSGTAVMLEVVNVLSALRKQGWRPLRSIHFASWDAEEYNLIGSTEYVEDHMSDLRDNAVAYLNVDVGVVGDTFWAAGSPGFERALLRVLDRVSDPVKNGTLRQRWDDGKSRLGGLGAGSDYVAFQDMAGCSSIDFGFGSKDGAQGFPYHSCYETFEWMERFGDPAVSVPCDADEGDGMCLRGFNYHKMLAQVWVLLILEFAQEPVVPFDLKMYAAAVKGYADDVEAYAAAKGAEKFDVGPLREAAKLFEANAKVFHDWDDYWYSQVFGRGGFENSAIAFDRMTHNAKLSDFETNLLDLPAGKDDHEQHGIPGREQFKHVVFGPQAWSGYDEAYFPAIRDAIDAGDWAAAQTQLEKASRILKRASEKLLD